MITNINNKYLYINLLIVIYSCIHKCVFLHDFIRFGHLILLNLKP